MKSNLIEKHTMFGGEQCKYKHYSETLKCEMTFSIFKPSNKENKETPIIWWLSGLSCTDDNFTQKSGFQRFAEKYNVVVVMPDTSPRGKNIPDDENYDLGQGAGFYINATKEPFKENYKMYTYITEELREYILKLIPNFSGKESIMGHSMGGHGALEIGIKNNKRFKSISAFAPILNPSEAPWGTKIFTNYLGENKEEWKEWDSTELIKENEAPPILIIQGTNDNFYKEQLNEERFLQNAKLNNQNIIYEKKEGYDHSYFFIATFIEEHFKFHMKYLG
ncbi:MAG: S-formylglutathione hydrolase [Clostridium sp.]|uniref:S-formylglutathione hydrolase n=1 Tax=Clostridium sp. TaxID=1506 RepID=UPI003EE70DD5